MGIYSIIKQEPINEVYFGQTPGIMRCFEAFSAWRSKYITDSRLYMMNTAAEKDPLLGKFIAEMEREFGLYSLSVVIVPKDIVNAFTIPAIFNFNSKYKGTDRVEFNRDGYKFKKECQVSVISALYGGLFFNSNYSNREVFAAFLHEIGHNFQSVISDKMHTLSGAAAFNRMLILGIQLCTGDTTPIKQLILYNDKSMGTISKAYNEMTIGQRNSIISLFHSAYGAIWNSIILVDQAHTAMNPFAAAVKSVIPLLKSFLSNILFGPILGQYNYYGELMADKFASYYGFGADLASCLNKFGHKELGAGIQSMAYDIPIWGHICAACVAPITYIAHKLDPHPDTQVRYKNIIEGLERDLNDPGLSPKLKKQLKAEIKELEKTTDNLMEKDNSIDNPNFLYSWLQCLLYKMLGGDLRYLAHKKIFDTEEDSVNTFIKNTKIK